MSGKPENSASARKKGNIAFAVILALLVIGLTAVALRSRPAPENLPTPVQTSFPVMGTVGRVALFASEAELTAAVNIYKQEFEKVNKVFSLHDPESELSKLNASASVKPFACSETMWFLLMRSQEAYRESDGDFDITVKPLMDLWGFYRNERKTVPSEAEIAGVLAKVGFDKLQFNEADRTVFFTVPGMALDFGGIAKGYAADLAAEKIVAAGITSGIIDIGGNLRILPTPPPGKKSFAIAMKDPADPASVLPEALTVAPGMAVSTSGNYERFIELDGKRYSHIISPKSGYPAEISAVTVVAPTALEADIFSTACVVGGEKTVETLQKAHPRLQIHFTR